METKRDALGVVDAINAEDIGKFPDTNLAESLQRITGVSIDRRNGEGSQVTARGFGPQFNLVTLNGRQIPGSDGFSNGDITTGGNGAGTRSFNFAQLASEAISEVEVYKTGRADIPTGGIGADCAAARRTVVLASRAADAARKARRVVMFLLFSRDPIRRRAAARCRTTGMFRATPCDCPRSR